ncbi:MAG: flagellar biosynthesis anti-sigma factor FlgM [Gammaproteobacteria bacterium]
MVAEVKGTTSGVVNPANQRPATQEVNAVKPPVQTGQAGGEQVHITSKATELQDLEKHVKAAPDVDVERVNRIRDAISDGSYKIDNDKLAQNILRQEMMMMAPTKGVEKK